MIWIKWTNLGVIFLLELCLLTALGYWGFRIGGNTIAKIGLAIVLPLLMAAIWGTFMAPKAAVSLPGSLHLALGIVLFGLGTAALYTAGQHRLAWAFALVTIVSHILAAVWRQ